MPCFKPIKAWRTLENTSNNKKAIAFTKSAAYSHPIHLPCGQCIGCRLARSLSWAIRCVHEAQLHQQNTFITLTYSPEHLPWDGSLVKSHFQDFMKRLRFHSPQKIRYYMCGEYGESFTRPHYHACLFGRDFPDKEIFNECEGILTYQSEELEKLWGKGFCTLSDFNFETAAYCARYITKKITGDQAENHYQTTCVHTGNPIQLQSEYSTMSRNPGIASDWYHKYTSDIYPSDYLIHQNRKVTVPRFYDTLYGVDHDLEAIKYRRKQNARKQLANNTPERLHVREQIKQLNYKQLKRTYENEA